MFTDTDLRDPAPPVPGATERAAVATRAKRIRRNRRVTAAAGALGLVAMLSVGVAAFAGGGSTNPSTTRVEVAGTAVTRDPAPTTVAPVPATVAPVVATPAETPVTDAPAAQESPAPAAAPATYTVSGSVPGIPAGVTATVALQGSGGSFTTTTAADGSFSVGGVPAGTYEATYSWESGDGAARVGRVLGGIDVTGSLSFAFPG